MIDQLCMAAVGVCASGSVVCSQITSGNLVSAVALPVVRN